MTRRELFAPPARIREHLFDWREPGRYYRTVKIDAGDRRVEISISPTGRSVRVYVDGRPIEAAS